MSRVRFSPQIITGMIMAIFFDSTLYFRFCLPYERVFGGDQSGARKAARFFTAQDETPANEIMDEVGSKYVTIEQPHQIWNTIG